MTTTTLPPLPVLGPTGEAIVLRSLGSHETVADLSRHLGVARLAVDGCVLDPSVRLVEAPELRAGVRLSEGSDGSGAAPADSHGNDAAVIDIAVQTGASVSGWTSLRPGRHIIGRASGASIRLDDPGVEPHHALLDVRSGRRVDVVQLCGATPIRRDASGDTELETDGTVSTLRLGSATVAIRRHRPRPQDAPTTGSGSTAAHPSEPWRRVVWRGPVAEPVWEDELLAVPDPVDIASPPSATGLVGVGATAAGAVVIALVLANAMFLLFAAMGVVAASATYAAGLLTSRRHRRRARRQHDEDVEAFRRSIRELQAKRRAFHTARCRSLGDTVRCVSGTPDRWTAVWERRTVDDASALSASIGVGRVHWAPSVGDAGRRGLEPDLFELVERCARLDGVAAPFDLAPGDVVAVRGPDALAASLVRSVVAQLAVLWGPADWQLLVVSSRSAPWEWTRWLPHGIATNGPVRLDPHDDRLEGLVDALESIDRERRTVVVTDEPGLLVARTGPLRRFLSTTPMASAIVIVGTDVTVPSPCRRTLTIGSLATASWSGDTPGPDSTSNIEVHGISVDSAESIARRLACLVDPDAGAGLTGSLPATVSLADIVDAPERSAAGILEQWRRAGRDPAPVAPVGSSAEGRVDIDLVRDGPHGLIAGTTGSGKSEFLRTLVVSLALATPPEHLNFVLVDYKGGSTFDACDALPHTVGVVTDLDGGLAARALASLDAELHRRERLLREVGASDLGEYRASAGRAPEPIARLVVVIDEFAVLARELPEFLAALVDIGRRGRSLGVHLLLATQRPAGIVNDDIRANTNLRLALRLNDDADALDVIGDVRPTAFQRSCPGRAALRLGPDELVTFQSARCTGVAVDDDGVAIVEPMRRSPSTPHPASTDGSTQTELAAAVDAVCEAARRGGHRAPHRPWADPLPFPLPASRLAEIAHDGPVDPIGWIDDPSHQTRRSLTWQPSDGSLALVGSVGSGITSTLIALAGSICGAYRPDELHTYVIDGRGDDRLGGLATLAHCGGVVRLTEEERMHRLLARVVEAIDRRLAGSPSGDVPRLVVMIDGFGSLRASLGSIERQDTFDLLARMLQDGPAVGVALVVADDDIAAIGRVTVADRWVFHLDDPTMAAGVVPRDGAIPAGVPGRCRLASTGSEAQVAMGALGPASLPAGGARVERGQGPRPIATLPERVERVPPDRPTTAGIEIGVAADDLGPARLTIERGDHVLVVGGPRTGVSSVLRTLVAQWTAARALDGEAVRVVHADRRRPCADAPPDDGAPTLLVVDDAHRVDDPGFLVDVIRGDHPHVLLVAGARADSVRTSYGHWTRELAKLRCGIVLTSRGDPDGDLLGVQVPRRTLVAPRPGLGWIIDGDPPRLAQIAAQRPVAG